MAVPIIINAPQGISIAEQKCYLQHEGNSQAIIDCLSAISSTNTIIMLVLIIIVIGLIVWAYV